MMCLSLRGHIFHRTYNFGLQLNVDLFIKTHRLDITNRAQETTMVKRTDSFASHPTHNSYMPIRRGGGLKRERKIDVCSLPPSSYQIQCNWLCLKHSAAVYSQPLSVQLTASNRRLSLPRIDIFLVYIVTSQIIKSWLGCMVFGYMMGVIRTLESSCYALERKGMPLNRTRVHETNRAFPSWVLKLSIGLCRLEIACWRWYNEKASFSYKWSSFSYKWSNTHTHTPVPIYTWNIFSVCMCRKEHETHVHISHWRTSCISVHQCHV